MIKAQLEGGQEIYVNPANIAYYFLDENGKMRLVLVTRTTALTDESSELLAAKIASVYNG